MNNQSYSPIHPRPKGRGILGSNNFDKNEIQI